MKSKLIFNQIISFLAFISILLFISSCEKIVKINKEAMFMNNKQHSGTYNSPSVLNAPLQLWKVKTGGQVISSPVIVDDMLYVGSEDHKLYAINTTSGEVKWRYETGGAINSTPVVSHGKILFLSYDGFFYALNQMDGKLIWKFKTGGESKFLVKDYYNGSFKPDFWDFYLSSAVVRDDMVYFGSSDTFVYALDIKTGKKIWQYKTEASIHSSPAIYENSLIIGSWDSNVYCLDAITGYEKWIFTTGKDIKDYIWIGIQASPSVENGIAYIGSRDAKFYALNIKTGDTMWMKDEFDRSWMPSTAAIGKEYIYTGSSDSFSFFSIDKKTGSVNYATKTNAYTFSSPAIDNEMAYIGAANGRIYGINLRKGNIKWEFKTEGTKTDTIKLFDNNGVMDIKRVKELTKKISDMPTLSSLYFKAFINVGAILSSPAIVDQVVYFGSSDGYVYAITDKIKSIHK